MKKKLLITTVCGLVLAGGSLAIWPQLSADETEVSPPPAALTAPPAPEAAAEAPEPQQVQEPVAPKTVPPSVTFFGGSGSLEDATPTPPDFNTFEPLGKGNSLTQIIDQADWLYIAQFKGYDRVRLLGLDKEARTLLAGALSKILKANATPENAISSSPDHKSAYLTLSDADRKKYAAVLPDLVARLEAESLSRQKGEQNDAIEELLGRTAIGKPSLVDSPPTGSTGTNRTATPAPMGATPTKNLPGAEPNKDEPVAHYPDGSPYDLNREIFGRVETEIAGKTVSLPDRGFKYSPVSKGEKIEPNAEAVVEVLREVPLLALIINRDKWDRIYLKQKFQSDLDEDAQLKFATALVNAIEQDPGVEGNRFEKHPESLYVFFSEKGYVESGIYLDNVLGKLKVESELRQFQQARQRAEQAMQRTQQLLGDSSESSPGTRGTGSSSGSRGSGRRPASSDVVASIQRATYAALEGHYPDGTPYSETKVQPDDPDQKWINTRGMPRLYMEGDNYQPVEPGTVVDAEAAAVAEALEQSNKKVLVIDRQRWSYRPSYVTDDPEVWKQFAQVLLRMIQQDDGVEGNRFEMHPDGLHIFFSEKGYQKNAPLFDPVMAKLLNEARQREKEQEAQREVERERQVEQLLSAVQSPEPDAEASTLQGNNGRSYRMIRTDDGSDTPQYRFEAVTNYNGFTPSQPYLYTGGKNYQTDTPGEKIEVDTDAIAEALSSVDILKTVIDREHWSVSPLRQFDQQARRQLAAALVVAIEKSTPAKGNRIELHPGELHIFFTREGSFEYAQYLGNVVSKLGQEASSRSFASAKARTEEMLRAADSEASTGEVEVVKDDANSVNKALKGASMLRITSDVPGDVQRFPLADFDEPAILTLQQRLRKAVQEYPSPQDKGFERHDNELYVHLSESGVEQLRQEIPKLLLRLTNETITRAWSTATPQFVNPPRTNATPSVQGTGYNRQPYGNPTYSPPGPSPTAYGYQPLDPALYKDEARGFELAGKIRAFQGPEKEKQKLIDELQQTLQKAFDVRLEHQRSQLEKAEAKLKASRDLLDKRQENAEKIIERRMDELTGNRAYQWNVPATPPPYHHYQDGGQYHPLPSYAPSSGSLPAINTPQATSSTPNDYIPKFNANRSAARLGTSTTPSQGTQPSHWLPFAPSNNQSTNSGNPEYPRINNGPSNYAAPSMSNQTGSPVPSYNQSVETGASGVTPRLPSYRQPGSGYSFTPSNQMRTIVPTPPEPSRNGSNIPAPPYAPTPRFSVPESKSKRGSSDNPTLPPPSSTSPASPSPSSPSPSSSAASPANPRQPGRLTRQQPPAISRFIPEDTPPKAEKTDKD